MSNYVGPFSPRAFAVLGSEVLFTASDPLDGRSLWETNGTVAGTSELSIAGATSTNIDDHIVVFGSEALFTVGRNGIGNTSLWVTNGTAAGSSEISLAGGSTSQYYDSNPGFAVLGSEVLFENKDSSGKYNVWVTDGTSAGTSELSVAGASSFGLLGASSAGFIYGLTPTFTVLGSEALFTGDDASGNGGLWVTNGTAAGTSELLAGANRGGLFPTAFLHFPDYTVFGSEVLFAGQDASGHTNLWVTNGTAAGTSELSVAGADPGGLLSSGVPAAFTVFGSEVLFAGNDASGHTNLWVTNGTAAGTSELSVAGAQAGGLFGDVFAPGVLPSFTVLGSKVLFAGADSNGGVNLWVTDGTAGGTPELFLNDGGTATYDAAATAALGDPTKLVFDYTVGANDRSVSALAVVGGSYNGATITDAAGVTPDFSHDVTTFPNLQVVVAPPATVTSVVASPSTGTEGIGQAITLTLIMSKAVTVSGGTPELFLNDGGTATYDAAATAALGDPTRLVFDYTVGGNDKSVSALAVVGGSYNGATIRDAGGAIPDFSNDLTTFPNLAVLVPPPAAVTSVVASPSTGTEGVGQTITLTLAMSRAVTVSGGTPQLYLNNGARATYDAAATAALNDPTKLVFDYTVALSDRSVAALSVIGGSYNGATIQDAAGGTPDFSNEVTTFQISPSSCPSPRSPRS